MLRCSRCAMAAAALSAVIALPAAGQAPELDDHQNVLDQIGIKVLRPGADAKSPALPALPAASAVTSPGAGTTTATGSPADPPPADQPVPRGDGNSQTAHRQLIEKAKQGRIDVYFLGDSITRRWGTSDAQYKDFLENWKQNFFGWNAGNFGWGADLTQNILWRVINGELDGVHPKVIILLAGANNVGTQPGDDAKVADVTRGIDAIVKACREKAPEATIIITAIFPRNDNVAVMPTIVRINENLAKLADGKAIRFLNVNGKLADDQGKLHPGMMVDGLHPSVAGYQIWADGLKPILTELLGPPASEDSAPPPTGDPSAAAAQ